MFTMVVEASHVMQFARAIGDASPQFERPTVQQFGEPMVAPPTFLMAADHFEPGYDRRPHPGVPWISTLAANPDMPTGFQTEQHFTFHRPVRIGDLLTVTQRPGGTWERIGRRAGRMVFRELLSDFHDASGALVVEARWVSASVEHRPPAEPPADHADTSPLAEPTGAPARLLGGTSWSVLLTEELTRTQIVMYAGASGDFHPMHTDEVYARKRGYPGVFAHGLHTMGMSGRVITDVVGHAAVRSFGGRITSQVWPGDRLLGHGRVSDIVAAGAGSVATVELRTENQHGQPVFTGTATVSLP